MTLRVFEAFAGYGSQSLALERLKAVHPDFDFKAVGYSEIDKYAVRAYDALHPGVRNFGDITAIEWNTVPDFDLFTYSSPCQSISVAGRRTGMAEGSGTASSLLWSCRRAISIKRPGFLLMENVPAILSKRNIGEFSKWVRFLESLGYRNYYRVVNAADYGVPQSRKRMFMVSLLKGSFSWPESFPLKRSIADIMEPGRVPDRYWVRRERAERMIRRCRKKQEQGCGFATAFLTPDRLSVTVTTQCGWRGTDPYIKIYEGTPDWVGDLDEWLVDGGGDTCFGDTLQERL